MFMLALPRFLAALAALRFPVERFHLGKFRLFKAFDLAPGGQVRVFYKLICKFKRRGTVDILENVPDHALIM